MVSLTKTLMSAANPIQKEISSDKSNQLFFRHISNFTKWLGALLIEVLAMKSSSKIKAAVDS